MILGCAVVTVVAAWRLRAVRLPLRTLCWWLATVVVFGAGVAVFDDLIYGGPLTTGYHFLVGATSATVVTALFAAGTWSFHVMIAPPPGP